MQIGEIIRLNRIKKGMTQADLSRGICSITHISKIESGNTYVAEEIINILCERLGISIEEEQHNYFHTTNILDKFYQAIIFCDKKTANNLKQELDNFHDYLENTPLNHMYVLSKLRYFIFMDSKNEAINLAKSIVENRDILGKYNKNLLFHCLGLYYIYIQDFWEALRYFNEVDEDNSCEDYTYYLSLAYYYTGSFVLSYHYAVIALENFRKSNNFKRVIDSEMLLALILSTSNESGIKQSLEMYEKLLILLSESNDNDKISRVYHNIGYNYLLLNEYDKASNNYLISMQLKEKNSYLYLTSLYSYIYCLLKYKKDFHTNKEIKEYILQGIAISKGKQIEKYHILFNILLRKYNQDSNLHDYIYECALPFFVTNKHTTEAKEFGTVAFNYFKQNGNYQKSTEIADLLLEVN